MVNHLLGILIKNSIQFHAKIWLTIVLYNRKSWKKNAKCFVVHKLKLEIMASHLKKQNKNYQSTRFISFFHVICEISNFNTWTAKHLAQVSCNKLTLQNHIVANKWISRANQSSLIRKSNTYVPGTWKKKVIWYQGCSKGQKSGGAGSTVVGIISPPWLR